ncbi:uncharacterized protein LOC122638845 [Telopea speciosissima]|uniref:uncharacterized protein LOC122638845 n=1 Tax=Telopea speciosissima TaxID=54955 RepID=UPI001CC514E6|nr:uncharacterized protein LOC122638845 [Telopea speciosissima]
MDAHVKRRTSEEVVAERHGKGPQQTTMENRMRSEEERDKLRSYFARWAYESGVPFNALRLRGFEELVEAIGQYGPGFKPPSFHDYRVPLLKSEKEKIDEIKKKHTISWKKGCTLMFDGWTDKKGRHLINFLVNSTEGTFFLGPVDASSQIQDAKMLFEFLDNKIEEIGEENVVQVVTDNASNYVAAGRHTRFLEAMRVHTRGADLVRAGATKFASSFLTLQSLLKHKDNLRKLFLFDHWDNSKLSHTKAGKQIVEIILSTPFWNGVQDCLRASLPLIQVLRIVDGDERPALPEVYIAMEEESDESIVNSLMHKANDAFNDILTRMVPDTTLQDKISAQSAAYTGSNGSCKGDVVWWEKHRSSTPELTKLARRLLGLCCSSSGCEHNWSIFEFIHTKKMNRLEHQRLNDLVYIQYNLRLQIRFQEKGNNPEILIHWCLMI